MTDPAADIPERGIAAAIPILTYHKVDTRREPGINALPPWRLRAHIRYLTENGYCSVTFRDLCHGLPLPPRPVILTFDDAYESVYHHALPLLQEAGMHAVLYAISGFVGKENSWDVNPAGVRFRHMDGRQLREMAQQGWEVGGHGITHRALTGLNAYELQQELSVCRRMLEDITGQEVVSLAYPFGIQNSQVRRAAGQAGYRFACRSLRGGLRAADRFDLPRVPVYQFDGPAALRRKLSLRRGSYEHLKLLLLSAPAVLTPLYQKFAKPQLVLDK